MSLFGSIAKFAGKALNVVSKAAPIVTGIATGGLGGVASVLYGAASLSKRSKPKMSLPALPGGGGRMLPPIGRAIATAAPYAAGAAAGILWDNEPRRKRRRRKGISAKDLQSFKRVARLVDKFAKPVHHFRNFKKGQ